MVKRTVICSDIRLTNPGTAGSIIMLLTAHRYRFFVPQCQHRDFLKCKTRQETYEEISSN